MACVAPPVAPPGLAYSPPALPEGPSGLSAKPGWATKHFAVAAANPLATDAGAQVLRAGGSALDAAVAAYLGASRIAPSRRITSPLSMSFSKMCLASFA